jgi:CRP-like cAMP-binding protein
VQGSNKIYMKLNARISPIGSKGSDIDQSKLSTKLLNFWKGLIIFPNSSNKVLWDFFVGILIMYSVTVIPFRIGFFVRKGYAATVFDIIVDICFGIDMVATFFTAFEDDGKLNIKREDIAKNYLMSWFLPDFVSTIPFDSIVPLIVHGVAPGTLRSIKLVRALRLFRLLKLFRVARLNRKMKEAKVNEIVHPIVYELGGLFSRIFVIAHILACMFYYISGCHDHKNDWDDLESWKQCGHSGNMYSHYLLSVYWTMLTMLSVGYGDVTLATNEGRLYSVFVMFVGSITFGFIVATVSESVKNWDPRETARKAKMDEIREYMTEKALPKVLKNKVWKHFDYYYNKLSTFPEDVILDSMPIMLQQLVLEKTRGDLSSFKLFRKEDYGTLSQVLPHLRPTFVEPHTSIVREGDYNVDMFFVVRGCVHASQQNAKSKNRQVLVGIYADGSDFGMMNALRCDSVSWATYRATVLTDVMWMSYSHVQRIASRSDIMKAVFESRAAEEEESQTEISKHVGKFEEVNNLRVPAFIICDGLVISCRNAIRMLGEDAVRPKMSRIFKTVTIMGKDQNNDDVYQENQETTGQMWDRWVINPHCTYKILFDLLVGLFVLMSAITLPYRLGFGIPTDLAWSSADAITEIIFFFDLVIAFFTAYEQSDYVLNTVHKNIARRYLKSWFIVDVISTIPLYRLQSSSRGAAVLRLFKTLKISKMFRMFRLMRLARLLKLVHVVSADTSKFNGDFVAFEDVFSRICKLIAFLGFVTHLTACFWSWTSLNVQGPNWHDYVGIPDEEYGRKYIAAVYWTYATMATVG